MANESTKTYMNINPTDISAEYAELVAQERELYQQQKALKAKQVDMLNELVDLPNGMVVVATTWTRWGQHQAICDKPQAVVKATAKRQSLADYLAAQR